MSAAAARESTRVRKKDPFTRRLAERMTHALEQARAARMRYRTLFDTAPEAMAVVGLDGLIVDVNTRWEQIVSLTRASLVGCQMAHVDLPGHVEVATHLVTIDGADVVLAIAREVRPVRKPTLELAPDGGPYPRLVVGASETRARGDETVLLVEGDPHVRGVVRQLLAGLGYRVFEARDGEEALAMTEALGDGIHLVLTETDLSGQSGADLVHRIQHRCGPARVLFMSRRGHDEALHDRMRHTGVSVIEKPFTASALARTVRRVLDAAQ